MDVGSLKQTNEIERNFMTRKLKRSKDFEIVLQLKHDDFIRPPRDAQRNWLLNRAITEFADDRMDLDQLAKRFVPGSDGADVRDYSQARLTDQEITEDWQIPVMQEMARMVTESLSRGHQRLVFKYFSSFSLKRVGPLKVPERCIDTLWADSMVVIGAVK